MGKDFRLKACLVFLIISIIAAYGMQLYAAVYIERDFGVVLKNIPFFSVIVAVLAAVGVLALRALLSPLSSALAKIDRGAKLSPAEAQKAWNVSARLPRLVIVIMLLAFLIGPIVSITFQILAGVDFPIERIVTYILVNFSIGFMAGEQIVSLIDQMLYDPLARLKLFTAIEGGKPVSLRGRIILAGIASALLTGILVGAAGNVSGSTGGTLSLGPRFALFLVCLSWSALVLINVAASITRRVELVASGLEEIGSAKGGVASRVPLVREDEIGRLAVAFNQFLDGFELLLERVKDASDKIFSGSGALAEGSSQAIRSVEGLEGALGAVTSAVERQTETVEDTKNGIALLVASIDNVAGRVTDQASSVEQSSAAVSEMAANIASVSRTAAKADELAKKLREASEQGGLILKDSLGAIGEIEETSRSVREIIGTISKIAAQTNLLAMNAAIEAAHAGEAGAGFAVVADEVRGLAESSSKSAKEIVSLIQGMIQKIERGATLTDKAGEAFGRITDGVSETGDLVQTIAASMSEQQEGAKEILESVGTLTEATQRIKDLTADQRAESKKMEEAMSRIVGASDEIFEAVQEETGSMQALGRVITAVSEEARKNRELVQGLEETTQNFKVEA